MQQPDAPRKTFKQLDGREKMVFVAKLMVFLVSFGFAFPLLLSD